MRRREEEGEEEEDGEEGGGGGGRMMKECEEQEVEEHERESMTNLVPQALQVARHRSSKSAPQLPRQPHSARRLPVVVTDVEHPPPAACAPSSLTQADEVVKQRAIIAELRAPSAAKCANEARRNELQQ